ncbi:sulfatase-like hydrolase/transferase [candidate division KSB1 bacterium]|nr:sulfatase-like hydrolase/transferase [candidate division KSB1 bacterium]
MSVAAAAVPALALGYRQKSTPAGRNIIFILSDDHRYDFMGFMGKPSFLQTPNMDRMAKEGAHVQNAFVTTSLCSPSRASILTGLYSHKHGVVDNQAPVPGGLQFFPQMLQQQGYETAFIGKWHMGHEHDDPRPGFDKWISFKGQGNYYNPVLNIDGERKRVEGYNPDILTYYAVDWIKQERQKPFFLYLSHKAVHGMFEPAKRHLGKYENEKIEYPSSMADTEENYRGKPRWVREQRNSWHGVDYMYHGQMDYETFYKRYCETVLGIDDSIGRLMQTLEALGIADSTLVIYMGDNGFCFGEHGLIDKRHMYEESIRVPMLAYCPEMIPAGSKVGDLVQNIDIAPTLLDAAGLAVSGDMDGRSVLPLLKGKAIPWRDAIYYEYYWERNFPQTPTMHGVRTDRYKYIHYHGIWDIDELYDLKEDPNEMNNLIFEPGQQDRIEKMNKMMYDWLERTNGMTIPLRRDRGFRAVDRKPE